MKRAATGLSPRRGPLLRLAVSACLLWGSGASVLGQEPVAAFPGAEGFGAATPGGRAGRLIEVTSLADSGPGTLRAAIETPGPRTVVFRLGGTIVLRSGLEISEPFITIAGQTAPGGGILIRNVPENEEAALKIETHDVVVRYLRIRPGPSIQPIASLDALTISTGAFNVIVDHCSLSWGTDEVASTWLAARDVTIQWSIISEGLRCSTHVEGCHSKGMLLGSDGSGNLSIHHNLLAHNVNRNPMIKTSDVVDIVNNTIYNPESTPSAVTDDFARARVNYVGNYYKRGPESTSDYLVSTAETGGDGFEIYVQGNIGPSRASDDLPQELSVKPRSVRWVVPTRHAAPPVTTTSAAAASSEVLARAGAWPRDDVDRRVVAETRAGTGGFIDHPGQVGGWPELKAGTAPSDSDHDGMADSWELREGLDPSDPGDGAADADGDGYTNLEEYLDELACAGPAELEVAPQNISTIESFSACQRLIAGEGLLVLSGGELHLHSGEVLVLDNGLTVEAEGALRVRAGPVR